MLNGQFLAAEGCQDLGTKSVDPCVEGQWASGGKAGASRRIVNFGSKGRRSGTRRRVSCTVTVQDVNRVYGTPLGNQGRCVRQTESARIKRKHGGEIAPAADHIELAARMVVGVGTDDRRLVLDRGNGRCSFDGERFVASWTTRTWCEWCTGGAKKRPEEETDLEWAQGSQRHLRPGNWDPGPSRSLQLEGTGKSNQHRRTSRLVRDLGLARRQRVLLG